MQNEIHVQVFRWTSLLFVSLAQFLQFLSAAISDVTWWRHQMETFSALLAICAGNSPVPGEFPTQRPVTRSFDVFFDLRLNKRLSKQWWGWWLETLSRHYEVIVMIHKGQRAMSINSNYILSFKKKYYKKHCQINWSLLISWATLQYFMVVIDMFPSFWNKHFHAYLNLVLRTCWCGHGCTRSIWIWYWRNVLHYNDFTWPSCLKSLRKTRLFVQHPAQANSRETSKLRITGFSWE